MRRDARRRAARAAAAGAVVVLATLLGACGGGAPGPASEAAGEPTPAFRVATVDGPEFTHPTGKPTVLFFMAGWCTDCLPEATALDAIERDLGDKVAILAVDADPTDPVESLRRFMATVGARYGFARDPEGRLTGRYGVRSLDTTVVTDAAGRMVFRDGVATDEDTLRDALRRAGAG